LFLEPKRYPEMSIKFFLPDSLSHLAKGENFFEVNGSTVGECLDQLVSLVPVMKQVLFYDSGDRLQPTIKVLVNQESTDAEGLAKELQDGDEIQIKLDRH
jgi:molybdopterin converting factor small subunit